MQNLLNKIPVGVPSIIITLIILIVTLIPASFESDNLKLFAGADKVIHFIMFFVLCFVTILDYGRRIFPRYIKAERYIAILVGCIFLGGVTEFLQFSMNIGRNMDLLDFLSDSFGILLAFIFYYFYFLQVYRRFLKKIGYTRK